MKAYCWASGLIEIGRKVPEGAICLVDAPAKALRKVLNQWSSTGLKGEHMIPGFAIAKASGKDTIPCVVKFSNLIAENIAKGCDAMIIKPAPQQPSPHSWLAHPTEAAK